MENEIKDNIKLPENAFTELKEGEEYQPVMSPDKAYPEVNGWSVTWGVLMAILFSAAAAYLGLRVGQVFEAAIPIAIIAVGVSTAAKRRNPLGENVIIQSIGACSGAVVAGAIFTLPALYILKDKYPEMSASFINILLSSLLGGILGILFLIPFRKYFVKDMHGKYPFPEATATTQVLVSGAKGGKQAKPLLLAGLVGGLYDFIVATFGWWNENFTTRVFGWGEMLADKAKLVFKVNTGAALLGLGYIVGLKYAFIICLGSLAVWWLIVPAMALMFPDTVLNQWNPSISTAVGAMAPEDIFNAYGKYIGIGGIAMAGIIGIDAPWVLYAIGAVIAIVLTWLKVPALAFALGMFIPIQLNIPLLIGGAINWYVTTRSKNEDVNRERGEKGTLIASGFIAGGALMGVVSALLRFAEVDVLNTEWLANPLSEICSLVAYALLIVYLIKSTKKA